MDEPIQPPTDDIGTRALAQSIAGNHNQRDPEYIGAGMVISTKGRGNNHSPDLIDALTGPDHRVLASDDAGTGSTQISAGNANSVG
ncbi:hypothetical protein PE067_13585 [Paracoccus sp. DMF-8]|uniref:hypothetical protein n=1 Tax=Paracoccus sp. DMF-8 TaxID=3019445 RepID=UPI0023E8701B|nr:hypothetical protein [Paracoccus sp. DMF-8]MDF3607071.1 hypothetical protein [Paracoccus sp. DMF-8]